MNNQVTPSPRVKSFKPKDFCWLLSLLLATSACQEQMPSPSSATVAISTHYSIDGENKALYTVSGTCSEHDKPVIIELLDHASHKAVPHPPPRCNQGQWSSSIDSTRLQDGVISISITQDDNQGRPRTRVLQVIKDSTGPLLSFSPDLVITDINAKSIPQDIALHGRCGQEQSPVVIELRHSKTHQVFSTTTIPCDAGTWATKLVPDQLPEGPTTITALHHDLSNNTSSISLNITKDLTPPTAALISNPQSITLPTAHHHIINGTCSENGNTVTVQLTDSQGQHISPNPPPICHNLIWQTALVTHHLNDGPIHITLIHQDSVGNTTSSSDQITKDVLSPSLTLARPQNHIFSQTNHPYTVSGTCQEHHQPIQVKLKDSADPPHTASSQSPALCRQGHWSTSVDIRSLDHGPVTIFASHQDAAGNTTRIQNQVLKTPSLIQLTLHPAPPINAYNKTAYPLQGTCTEHAQPVTVTIAKTLPPHPVTCQSDGTWQALFDVSSEKEGSSLAIVVDHQSAPHQDRGVPQKAPQLITSTPKDTLFPSLTLHPPSPIDKINHLAYPLSGTCSEQGQPITITIKALSSSTPCQGGRWQTQLDLHSLADGPVPITLLHRDLAQNTSSLTAPLLRTSSVIITLQDHSRHRQDPNQDQNFYSLSGTCSENTQAISISLPHHPPTLTTCTQYRWQAQIDTSNFGEEEIPLTLEHAHQRVHHSICHSLGTGDHIDQPLAICNYQALQSIRHDLTKYYALVADIDASPSWREGEEGCTPYNGHTIATNHPCPGHLPLGKLKGGLDGRGHSINHLYINRSADLTGLFAQLGRFATVKNLHLNSVQIHSLWGNTGAIAGYADHDSKIENCSVQGTIGTGTRVGGLVGRSHAQMFNNYGDVSVRGVFAGGLVGDCQGGGCHIVSSHSRGVITGPRTDNTRHYAALGGLAGLSQGTISYSYSLAQVSGGAARGGLVGHISAGRITYAYFAGSIDPSSPQPPENSKSSHSGGLAGTFYVLRDDSPPSSKHTFWDRERSGQNKPVSLRGWEGLAALQGLGLPTRKLQQFCPEDSTHDICRLQDGFTLTAGHYPQVRKCRTCAPASGPPSFYYSLVGGQ